MGFTSDNLFLGIAGPRRAGRRKQPVLSLVEGFAAFPGNPRKRDEQHRQTRIHTWAFKQHSPRTKKKKSETVLRGRVKAEGQRDSKVNIKQHSN